MVETADPRKMRTRQALLAAFGALFVERGYEAIRIGDIIARAGVGRSTFYEHYRSKDALFAHSIEHMVSRIATIVDSHTHADDLVPLFEHFWGNRGKSRRLHTATGRRQVTRVLAAILEKRLTVRITRTGDLMPVRIAAFALAEMLVGSIVAWQSGEIGCDPSVFAHNLHRLVRGTVAAV